MLLLPERAISLTPLLVALVAGGCSSEQGTFLSSRVGKPCTVFFRHDALGMAATIPADPLGESLNGGEMSIHGTLAKQNSEWIVINDRQQKEIHIPYAVILNVEFDPQ